MRIPPSALTTRATHITSENRSDAITVATWVTLVLLSVVFVSREAIKFIVVRRFAIDDLFILAATIFAIGLSVSILTLASDGLGVFEPLTLRRANELQKGYYASNFLYIATLGFAKLSLVVFFYKIHEVQRTQRRIVYGLGIFILAWTIASLVTIAFQCGFTRPWEMFTLHCYDVNAFWVVFCIIDMTTDVSLVMLSVNLVYYLKVKSSRKVAVVACFAPRILVIGASLTRLIYLFPITPHTNPSFNLWIPIICTQVQASLSIVTACIPYMRPFFYKPESKVPAGDQGSRGQMMVAEESYTHYSSNGYSRGHKRGQGFSQDSTTPESWNGRTPDVSPRLPSPAPLSPLLPPRLTTPPNSTSNSSSRSPSERGLKLQIPQPTPAVNRATFISPQTASSHALSPDCVSPVMQPFLSNTSSFFPIPLTPRSPTPPPPCHTPPNGETYSGDESDMNVPIRNSITRFSLFPSQQAPRYSLVPQSNPQPPTSIPTAFSAHSRSNSKSAAGATSMSRTAPQVSVPETQTTSPTPPGPHARHHPPPAPISPPSKMRKSPPASSSATHLANIAYDDPLRITSPPAPATALTTTSPTPAPLFASAPLPAVLESPHPSTHANPQHPTQSALSAPAMTHASRRRMRSESNPTAASHAHAHYAHTPHPPPTCPPTCPLPQLPTFESPVSAARQRSHSSPYQARAGDFVVSPTSPQRQRNRRILTPRNSSRDFSPMSPISPVSPATPVQFWREEAFGNGAGRTAVPSALWDEQELQPAMGSPQAARPGDAARAGPRPVLVRDAPGRSPRIVVQSFE